MLENPRSPRVRSVAKLAKKASRSESGLFLLEGPQAVSEALRFRPELVLELIAILEEVRDPGNAGTIVRAADAAGADAVVFTGRAVDLYNPKVVRSSTGSIFHLPVAVGADLGNVLERARAAGLSVIAADVKGDDLLAARNDGVLA